MPKQRIDFENEACQAGVIYFNLKFPNSDQFHEFTAKKGKKRWELWVIGSTDKEICVRENIDCAWDCVIDARIYLCKKLRLGDSFRRNYRG